MQRLVSWPMYAVDADAVETFWTRLREALVDAGLSDVPAALTKPDDLVAHWRDPSLLLSQTCGYPFVTGLAGRVRYVATPRFAVPGCADGFYRSAVVVRRDEPATSLSAMRGCRAAFNSRDSQSGYNGLRALVAPLAAHGRFFGDTVETGAHRLSLQAVASGAADLAAIDVVTLALITSHEPAAASGLRVLCHTAAVPGLPLVTAAGTSDADLMRLRHAIDVTCRSDAAARALRLSGAAVLSDHDYRMILAQRDDAFSSGYGDLA